MMKTLDIGLLLAESVRIGFNGMYFCNGIDISGESIVSLSDDMLLHEGKRYDELLFIPCNDFCRFEVYDVVIGVDFHWERKETQVFEGALLLFVEKGKIRVVNRISVEDYLTSVISSEMSATSSLQFLKAHAIVSRSWLYAQLARAKEKNRDVGTLGYENECEIIKWYARENHDTFDFCADDHCQRYQGVARIVNNNVQQAVKETKDVVLVCNNEVCDARFSKCCGGVTEVFSSCWEDKDVEYLLSFRDIDSEDTAFVLSDESAVRDWIESTPLSFCAETDANILTQILNKYDCETNDFYRWKVEYGQNELSELVRRKSGIDFGRIEELVPVKRGFSGRIIKLNIIGTKCSMTIGKELEIRRVLSETHLYSSAFVVDKKCEDGENYFVLHGAGWGHGVGLCQIGAAVMGERGFSYDEILKHYYPNTELRNVNELDIFEFNA